MINSVKFLHLRSLSNLSSKATELYDIKPMYKRRKKKKGNVGVNLYRKAGVWRCVGPRTDCLQVFKLIYSSLGIALADLPQCLVLVSALSYILLVNFVHGGFLFSVSCGLKVMLESLQKMERIKWLIVIYAFHFYLLLIHNSFHL